MAAGVTIEITERRAPAPPDVQQQRADMVDRLDNLGQIDASTGTLASDVLVGFDVSVNGVAVLAPAAAYEVVPSEQGPQVTLTFVADALTIGPKKPSPASPAGRAAATWGDHRPDPREGIPGWKPEVPRG